MNCAWKAGDAPEDPGPMWLLVILADHSNNRDDEDWTAFPSVEKLMKRSRFGRSAVEGHLKTLVTLGWISRKRRSLPGGRKGIYDYELHGDPAFRARLKAARAAIVEAGQKPSGEAKDADHPCVKITHGPCPNSEPAMPEIHAPPCVKSEHVEPPLNPQTNPHSGRARELTSLFEEMVAVAPPKILKFCDRDAAFEALVELDNDGEPVSEFPTYLRRMAADPEFKSRKHPPQLHSWLSQRQYLGWKVQPELPLAAKPGPAATPLDVAPEEDQAIWRRLRGRLEGALTEKTFQTWFGPAYLAARGGTLFLVVAGATARDWIVRNAQRRVDAWWAEMDPAKRPLTLTTKLQFEAASRQGVD